MVGNAAGFRSHGVSLPTPLVAHAQPTSPPAPLQGRCVPLLSTPLPVPWRRDGLVTALASHEGGRGRPSVEGECRDLPRGQADRR